MVTTKIGDFYEELVRRIDKGELENALGLFNTQQSKTERLAILQRLARDLAHALERDLDLARNRDLALERELISILEITSRRTNFIVAALEHESGQGQSTIILDGIDLLTPEALGNQVAPFLQALSNLQSTISQVSGEKSVQPRIRSISQNSPIEVSAEGLGGAIRVVREIFSPYWRRHAKRMAELEEKKKQAELLQIETDIALKILSEKAPNLSENERLTHLPRLIQTVDALINTPITLPELPE